jgi:hypothetical protein
VGIKITSTEIPKRYNLYQNYPNPFNPVTQIRFDIPAGTRHGAFVQIQIFDDVGKEILTLVNEELKAGKYSVDWNAAGFPSGVYFYVIRAGDFAETRKMILLK